MKETTFACLILLCLFTTVSSYADYTVQIGAYKGPTTDTINNAKTFGETFQTQGSDNLVRVSVGRFIERIDAEQLRDQLIHSGYYDAFITELDKQKSLVKQNHQATNSTSSWSLNNSKTNYTLNNLSQLSRDEKSLAAYLDGKLMILSNGEFYTVQQYRDR